MIFGRNVPFLTDSLNPHSPSPTSHHHLLNSQSPLIVMKVFCRCSLNQKGYFQTKRKKVNMDILRALNAFNKFFIFKLFSVPNFTLNSFEFWDQVFPKRVFLVQNRKSSHNNWILHIWVRLGSKFQVKLITLIFWTKFVQKLVLQKIALFHVSMVITYYIKLIRMVANRHDNISVSFLLLVVETTRNAVNIYFAKNLPLT